MASCDITTFLFALICFSGFMICKADYRSSATKYDVGCFAQRKKILSYGLYAYINGYAPTCLEGGVYRHYQCNYIGCYCVYVDTGNSYGHYVTRRPSPYLNVACNGAVEEPSNGCEAPQLNYPCTVNTIKYVFNSNTQTCESVGFGCRGYQSLGDCENACVPKVYDQCSFFEEEGRHCEGKNEEIRYRHDEEGECVPFTYLGCGGNSNNYKEAWDCEKTCVASAQELISVRIRVEYGRRYNATVPQWMVNKYQISTTEENDVVESVFEDIEEYASSVVERHDGSRRLVIKGTKPRPPHLPPKIPEAVLERLNSSPLEVCQLPPKTGLCRAYIPRWYYDDAKSKCFKFVFGGCSPNGNNFRRSKDCTAYCNALFTPSPLEEASPPRDRSGKPIKVPKGANIGYEIDDGVLIYRVLGKETTTTKSPTTTSTSIYDNSEDLFDSTESSTATNEPVPGSES